MKLSRIFIQATREYNTFEKTVPAYYFRRAFRVDESCSARITVAVCGFYELFLNGSCITKGFLSPYISNTNDYIYYDEYDVTLDSGENVIGIWLGNGLQNNPGGHIWDFDKAEFRSAPMFALSVTQITPDGNKILLESDESFKTSSSPIRSDDYRFGEYYDANYEIEAWNQRGFDDTDWQNALSAIPPRGELRLADVPPIIKETELAPVNIIKSNGGYIYDFGMSNAGICRLKINGTKGQKIELRHADSLKDGDIDLAQVWFVREFWERDSKIVHLDTYVCKGEGTEIYEPTFTYHGFRYVRVDGITEEQATKELLTYLVYHTELNSRGDFTCSDGVATKLQEMTRRSITSNFHHFPTDCPQREKNGWTADAALSSEAALLNFDPERNYREWMRNICKAQKSDGSLPGIVPTGGWGFDWGNGPAWDCILAYLPYYTYLYRGETDMIVQSAQSFISYLKYLRTRCDENGLLSIGLGDWCHVGRVADQPKAPLIVTDSIIAMDVAVKMAEMLEAVKLYDMAQYARDEAKKYRQSIRQNLINFDKLTVAGECQACQAMAIHYGVFEKSEITRAFENLLQMINECEDHMDVGVLGGRVIFHVLTEFGYSDLAFKMITREDFPSYGNLLACGATTLWEQFLLNGEGSKNHHFWGDISSWFIKCIVGIRLNPKRNNVNELEIRPSFIGQLSQASAYHIAPSGKISVSWRREEQKIILDVKIPQDMSATVTLESGYSFENGSCTGAVVTGIYNIVDNNSQEQLAYKK